MLVREGKKFENCHCFQCIQDGNARDSCNTPMPLEIRINTVVEK
jgi:hypothetical protein